MEKRNETNESPIIKWFEESVNIWALRGHCMKPDLVLGSGTRSVNSAHPQTLLKAHQTKKQPDVHSIQNSCRLLAWPYISN